jgi:hypothetical protein
MSVTPLMRVKERRSDPVDAVDGPKNEGLTPLKKPLMPMIGDEDERAKAQPR